MEIIPNSTVKLFKNVPLNADYHDTLWWVNKGAQYSYFNNLPGKVFNQLTYVRKERNTIRLECKMEDVFDCNYMAFLNTNFVNKWFYAFVLDVNYINNETCEIVYQIDTVQTWFFEMDFEDCYIERQHSTTDMVGDNITPENLGQYRYVNNQAESMNSMNEYWEAIFNRINAIVITGESHDGEATYAGNVYDGTYSGLSYFAYPIITYNSTIHAREISDGINGINQLIAEYTADNKANSIVGIILFPSAFMSVDPVYIHQVNPSAYGHSQYKEVTINDLTSGDLNGYTPKNNKLYTYPYNCIYCTIGDNISRTIRIEELTDTFFRIDCLGSLSMTPEISLQFNDNKDYNVYDNRLTLSNFPQCAYVCDSYKMWQAYEGKRMQNNLIANTVGSGASMATSLATSLAVGGMVGSGALAEARGIGSVTGWIGETLTDILKYSMEDKLQQSVGDKPFGTFANNVDMSFGTKYPHCYQYCYDARDLKRIDDFFTMYGYAQGTVGKPNLHARSKWTYVKTKGCQIHGQMPTIVQNELEGIFNNGVRFWTSPNYIGNYDQTNNVL